MTSAARIALTLSVVLSSAPRVHAQNKPTLASPDTVAFQTVAFLARAKESPDFMDVIFQDSIPVGKRLIVQYVSVNFFATGIAEPVVGARCLIQARELSPRRTFDFVAHFIPLSIQQNFTRKVAAFTGGQALTAYMEAGETQAIQLQCFAGAPTGDGAAVGLQAQLTGLLVNK